MTTGSYELVLELDKLVRTERTKLIQSNECNEKTANQTQGNVRGLTVHQTGLPPVVRDSSGMAPSIRAIAGSSPGANPSTCDLRQVRLFKTRFCQYGSDCPYLLKGTCLYAHNREEVRSRPPPPRNFRGSSSVDGDDLSRSTSILECLRSSVPTS